MNAIRRSHLALSALAIAFALGLGWLVRSVLIDERPSPDAQEVSALDGKSGATELDSETALGTPSETSLTRQPPSARTQAGARVSAAGTSPVDSDAELAHAVWVQGKVRLPSGTPADEHVEVVADGREFAARPLYRASIAPDGSFRVAFSKATKRGKLRVEGRYLYLPEPFALKLAEVPRDILLEPVVGGCIRGRFILPPNALEEAPAVRGTIVQFGRCPSYEASNGPGRESAVKTNDRLEFEIDHLSTSSCWAIRARPKGFVAFERRDLHLKPGVIESVEVDLRLGARITGRVEDESGAPIEGVRFASARKRPNDDASYEVSPALSAVDGAFDCAGLLPGDITLTASKEGYLSATFQAGNMADGARRDAAVFVLRLGQCVAGRVQWPDGRPVVSGRVDLRAEREASSSFEPMSPNRRVQTADNGSFKITGLEEGTFTLTARAVPDTAPKPQASAAPAAASPTEKKLHKGSDVEWIEHLEKVKPGGAELVLVLRPGKTIQGRVVDDLGHPIESFSLEIHSVSEADLQTRLHESLTRSFRDAEGLFQVSDLHDGAWSVGAQAKGFALGKPRSFRLPADTRLADLVLVRGASIAGVVVDAHGQPVAKAELRIVRGWDGSGLDSSSSKGWDPSTDGAGRFEWKDIAPGNFELRASARGWADSAPMPLDLLPGQTLGDLALTLRAGGRLTGEVFDSAGRPDAHRPMYMVARGSPGTSKEFAADSLGRISVEHLVPGTYDIWTQASAKEREALQEGGQAQRSTSMRQARATIVDGETAHVTIGAPPQAPVRVHGVVTSGLAPVADMRLYVHGRRSGGENVHHTTTSDARGRYEVVLDEPGDWSFFLALPSGTTSGRHEEIPKVASHELDLTLPSGTIGGRVVDPSGQPVAGLGVSLITDPGTAELSSIAAGGGLVSDASGRFRFDSLPAGTYALSTNGVMRSAGSEEQVYARLHQGGLVLRDGAALADIELRLAKAGRLEGVVLGLAGAPVSHARVHVRDATGRAIEPSSPRPTAANGRFEWVGLSPGRYTVFARTDNLCSSESAPVTVRSDDSAEVELTLQPSALLRVVVKDEEGRKIGSMISVVDSRGRDFGPLNPAGEDDGEAESLSRGRQFGPLPPGTYAVRATNHDKTSCGTEAHLGAGEQRTVTLRFGR